MSEQTDTRQTEVAQKSTRREALAKLRDVLGLTDTDETLTMLQAAIRISRLESEVEILTEELDGYKAEISELCVGQERLRP